MLARVTFNSRITGQMTKLHKEDDQDIDVEYTVVQFRGVDTKKIQEM